MAKKILIAVLLSVAVIAAVVAVCFIVFKEEPVLNPDYAPPAVEENAEKIEGDDGEKMEVSEGGGGVNLIYKNTATIDLSDEQVTMHFANPGSSYNNTVVQIVVQGTVVAQSGTIKPGYRVTKLNLLEGAADRLVAGVYETDTKLVMLYYDPDTDERAILVTEIPATIQVKE